MIRVIILGLLALPIISHANPQMLGMTPAQMQDMQRCMQGIDHAAVEKLEKRGNDIANELTALCKKGHREEAMSKGLAFREEIQNSPVVKKIRSCTSKMPGMMTNMLKFENLSDNAHVCDETH